MTYDEVLKALKQIITYIKVDFNDDVSIKVYEENDK